MQDPADLPFSYHHHHHHHRLCNQWPHFWCRKIDGGVGTRLGLKENEITVCCKMYQRCVMGRKSIPAACKLTFPAATHATRVLRSRGLARARLQRQGLLGDPVFVDILGTHAEYAHVTRRNYEFVEITRLSFPLVLKTETSFTYEFWGLFRFFYGITFMSMLRLSVVTSKSLTTAENRQSTDFIHECLKLYKIFSVPWASCECCASIFWPQILQYNIHLNIEFLQYGLLINAQILHCNILCFSSRPYSTKYTFLSVNHEQPPACSAQSLPRTNPDISPSSPKFTT